MKARQLLVLGCEGNGGWERVGVRDKRLWAPGIMGAWRCGGVWWCGGPTDSSNVFWPVFTFDIALIRMKLFGDGISNVMWIFWINCNGNRRRELRWVQEASLRLNLNSVQCLPKVQIKDKKKKRIESMWKKKKKLATNGSLWKSGKAAGCREEARCESMRVLCTACVANCLKIGVTNRCFTPPPLPTFPHSFKPTCQSCPTWTFFVSLFAALFNEVFMDQTSV